MSILGHDGGTHEGYGLLTGARALEAIDGIDFSKSTTPMACETGLHDHRVHHAADRLN